MSNSSSEYLVTALNPDGAADHDNRAGIEATLTQREAAAEAVMQTWLDAGAPVRSTDQDGMASSEAFAGMSDGYYRNQVSDVVDRFVQVNQTATEMQDNNKAADQSPVLREYNPLAIQMAQMAQMQDADALGY